MHWAGTITLGNLLTIVVMVTAALFAWRDLNWRVRNLEIWRKEQIVNLTTQAEITDNLRMMPKLWEAYSKSHEKQEIRHQIESDRRDAIIAKHSEALAAIEAQIETGSRQLELTNNLIEKLLMEWNRRGRQ